MTSHINSQRNIFNRLWKKLSYATFHQIWFRENRCAFLLTTVKMHRSLTRHTPHFFAIEDRFPVISQRFECRIRAIGPACHIDQKRSLGESLIGLEMIERIAWKQSLHRFGKIVFQSDIDTSHGPVEVNRTKQIRASLNEVDQSRQSTGMNRQAILREEAVMDEARDVERFRVVSRHVRITEDEVHVIDSVDSAEKSTQFLQPVRMSFLIIRASGRSANKPRNLPWIQFLQRLQPAIGVSANSADDFAEFMLDNVCSDIFMRQIELFEIMIIEEMAERTMTNVMQEPGDSHHAFNARPRRHIPAGIYQ